MDYAKHELQDLAKEINLEEQQVAELLQQYTIDGKANGSIENDNNTNGWVDEMAVLSLAKWTELHEEIWPVKLVLVKVCHEQIDNHRLTMLGSFERWHSKLSTHQQNFFQHGDSS